MIRLAVFFGLIFLSLAANGEVVASFSQEGFSKALTLALSRVDPSLKARVEFLSNSTSGVHLRYTVALSAADLRFEQLEAQGAKTISEIRASLGGQGVKSVEFSLQMKLEMQKEGNDLLLSVRFDPKTLLVSFQGEGKNVVNEMIQGVFQPLLVGYSKVFLDSIEKKYLKNLQIGKMLNLQAGGLSDTHTITGILNMNQVNEFNILSAASLVTEKKRLLVVGSVVKRRKL